MTHSGDAAEQIVRMSLEGVEVAARITGNAAKEIALLLIAAMKSNSNDSMKLKGKERLSTMLKSGKALEIISVRESDLRKFMHGAKQYGIVFCVLRSKQNKADGLCDIMVKADDAPKISRLLERLAFATVDRSAITSGDTPERAAETVAEPPITEPEVEMDTEEIELEALLDDLLGTEPEPTKKETPDFPETAAPISPPSEHTSESKKTLEEATSGRPSVKEELREIAAAKKAKEAEARTGAELPDAKKPPTRTGTKHKQPRRGKSRKRGHR